MTVRELTYPHYDVEVGADGDTRMRFFAPGSKFGPVHIVLRADDAALLRSLLAAAPPDPEAK